jgi:hypothetical protein
MVWGTAGRDRNGPSRRARHRLTNAKPVQPQVAQARTRFGVGDQSNQKQTHTQQAEQSHAVCFSKFVSIRPRPLDQGKHPHGALESVKAPAAFPLPLQQHVVVRTLRTS